MVCHMMTFREAFWASVRWFEASEFSNPGAMDPAFICRLDLARERAGVPFVVTSSYRPGDRGAHGAGQAVDIACEDSKARWRMVEAALHFGMSCGVYSRHVHMDVWSARSKPVCFLGYYFNPGERDEATENVSEEVQEDVHEGREAPASEE